MLYIRKRLEALNGYCKDITEMGEKRTDYDY